MIGEKVLAKLADFRDFFRIFRRTLFVSVLCFAFGFMSAWAGEYTITYLNQHGDEISDLTPDRYTEEELPLTKENLPNSEAVSIATGCELADELWYWDDKMSEPVDKIESVSDEGTTLYGNLSCDENRIVTLNPAGKEGIGSEGTRTLYYYRNLGDSGEFFYNEYNGSKSAARLASTVVLPTYDDKSYTFLGYYADPDDMETQCVDERGYITEYGFQQMAEDGEGETSWDAVYEERSVADVHTVNYNCGNHGSGSPVSQSANAYDSVNLPLANVCAPDSGYEFFGWSCYTSDINTVPNTTIKAAGESLYMNVDWTCTALWVDVCPNSGVRMSILDDYSGTPADLVNNSFSSYATVSASGMCSSTPGTYQYQSMAQEPSSGTGYCWCHITAFNGVSVSDYSPWVYISGDGGTCDYNVCQAACNRYTGNNAMGRISLTDACAYNLSYTCGVISGSVYPQSDTVFLNETVNLPQYANGCTFVSGASFLGWDCHVSGNPNTINNGYSLTMPDNNVVCDALWDAPQYTLTYDCGVNGTAPAGVTQNGGSNVQLANGCNGALSSDYDFQGWYCVLQNGSISGNAYNGGDFYPLYDNTICTAIWTESNPCDPGTVVDQVILGMYGSDFDLWHESLVGNGNNTLSFSYGDVYLEGMCSNTPGMYGVPGNPESSVNSANNTYCWCRARSFTPTGGENPIPLDNNSWVYSGFYDAGGCTDSHCQTLCTGEVNVIDGWQDFFLPGLYTANICEYTLTYNCANGNNAQSALSGGNYQGGQSMGLWVDGGNCTAPTNQTFDYWTCNNGTVNNNIVNPTPYDNMTCTAHWKNLPTYSLTYNCNNNGAGGSAPTDSNSPYYAGTTGISLAGDEGSCNPPSNNIGFLGWSCHKENDSSVPYSEGDAMPAYNVVCDAQWEQLYNVIYNCNNSGFGGTAPATQSYYVGNTVSILSTMPQNTCVAPNMMFDHWDCHKENDNTVSFNSGSAMQAYNVVCDAQWVHRVEYSCGSGTQLTPNIYETTSAASVVLADIGSFCTVPSGYVFYKWSCVPNGGHMYGDFYGSGYNYVFTSPAVYCTAVYREISCNSGETTVPFVLGQEMTLTDWENNSSVWGEYSNITLGNLWNPTSASYSGNSATFSNSSSNWTVTMNGKCSYTWWMLGETGHPSDTFGNNCWCQVGSIVVNNGSGVSLSGYPWVYAGIDATQSSCTTNSCSNICAIQAANGYNYSTDMANFFLQSLYTQNTCISVPTAYTVTYHGGSCNASASTFYDTVNAGASYTVENPECASSNSNNWLPTDGCREFIGWSDLPYNSTQTASSQVVYGTCDACITQSGSCGTITNVSSNIDLYAICDVMAHNVIYHDCDNTYTYIDSNAVWIGQSPNYTPLSPSVAPLSSSNLKIDPLSSFQGWATTQTDDGGEWCALSSDKLYKKLFGGNSGNADYKYTETGKMCKDVHLYAVCCPLNLSWGLNGGGWPTGSSGNLTTCEYGAIAGSAGSIGYGQTPLQTPLRTGYTFTGWKVTDYSTP